jgi:hypothetical protein
VKGKEYNFPRRHGPMAYQTDEQIAAVLTYVRNSFGNKASAVKPEQVAALRSEVGKPPGHRRRNSPSPDFPFSIISNRCHPPPKHHDQDACCARGSTARCAIR